MFSSLFWHHINYTEQSNSRFAGLRFIFSTQLQCHHASSKWFDDHTLRQNVLSILRYIEALLKVMNAYPTWTDILTPAFFPFFRLKVLSIISFGVSTVSHARNVFFKEELLEKWNLHCILGIRVKWRRHLKTKLSGAQSEEQETFSKTDSFLKTRNNFQPCQVCS